MMFDVIQLLERITAGESSAVEFKEARIVNEKVQKLDNKSLSDEIAAFANAAGGTIIFGVSDAGEVLGIGTANASPLINFISEICHDSVKPSITDYYVNSIEVPDGSTGEYKTLVYIKIDRSLWTHNSAHGYFQRQGSCKREMTPDQLNRLMQSRSQAGIIRFEEQAVPNTDKSTLSRDLFSQFLTNPENEQQELGKLKNRKLLIDDNGALCASVAGVLMCCDKIDDYFPNAFICAVYYRSKDKDANYQIDAQDFKGPLNQQIFNAYQFVAKHNQKSARKERGREEKLQYSMKAVFEAIVNAVVHRDYSIYGSKIRLFMFADRLEIYSPGALANSTTIESLEDAQSTRNELLSRLLSELNVNDIGREVSREHFLERRGEGVGIIFNESKKQSGKKPIYQMSGHEELCLTIFAAKSLQEE